jgi:hypothetical protein
MTNQDNVSRGLGLLSEARDTALGGAGARGEFYARDPETVAPWLRPIQSAGRRACDIWAHTGSIGRVGPVGQVMSAQCNPYLGGDAPTFSPGDETVCLTFEYNDVASPGQPWRDAITVCGIQKPYTIEGPETSISGFAGCIYAQTPDGPVPLSCTNFSQFVPDLKIREVSESPDGGQPPGYPPTRPGPPPPSDYDYDGGDGNVININVGGPTLNIDGSISLNVDVGGVGIDLAAGSPYGPGAATPPTNPQPTQGPLSPSDTQPETPPVGNGKILVGCDITVVDGYDGGINVSAGGGRILKIPRHGSIYFVGTDGKSYGPFDVQLTRQTLFCPPELRMSFVRSVPVSGVVWNVRLLFIEED